MDYLGISNGDNQTTQRPNLPVFSMIIQLNILEITKYVQLYLVASRLGGVAVPVPSPFVVTRQIQAPRVRMKEHPPPPPPYTCQTTMCLFPRHYLGLTPWKIPTAIATGGAIENPSEITTALINTLTLILLKTRKVR